MILDIAKSKRLWQWLRPYWGLELASLGVMIGLAALSLSLPLALQYLIDELIPRLAAQPKDAIDLSPIVWFGLILVGIYVVNVGLSWLRDWLGATIGANIIKDIRSSLFAHLQRLPLSFHREHQVGEVMSRLLSDAGRLENLLTETLLMFIASIFLLLAVIIYLAQANWMLTAVALIPVPITILMTNSFGRKLNHLSAALQASFAALSGRLQESLTSIRTIKAFGQEAREEKRLDGVLGDLVLLTRKASVTSSLAVNLVQFANMVGPIVVLAWGVYLVASGEMKLGQLIAFYVLLSYLYTPVRSLAQTNIQVQTAMASADRLFEYWDIPPTVVESAHPVTLTHTTGHIEFKNIALHYPNSQFAIDALSLAVAPKEKIAIVGPSGSGKTSVLHLLMRFADPDSGEILIDGIDLRQLSLASLRQNVALVEQEPLLFSLSVRDNIAYGNPTASTEAIIAAARAAQIHDLIMTLPQQYETLVAERGQTLSGGERQRICLARAIVSNPSILLLDEATSSLDSTSEHLIQQALETILADKTAIIVAHRLATVQHVDRIVTMDNGRIVDIGSHSELSIRCPLYRDLAAKQLLV